MKEAIFGRRLRALGDSCYLINWYCVDVYASPPMVRSSLFAPVAEWWRPYNCSHLLFLPTLVEMAYYSSVIINRRVPELVFHMAISKVCVCALMSFLHSELAGGPVGFSSDFTGFEDTAAWGVLFLLPEGGQNFVQSVGFSRIISKCNVSSLKGSVAHSQWTEFDCPMNGTRAGILTALRVGA